MYAEPDADFNTGKDEFIYCGVNTYWEEKTISLPNLPEGMNWKVYEYTGVETASINDKMVCESFTLMPRSLVVLVGKKD
jgi:glycogen operon protein